MARHVFSDPPDAPGDDVLSFLTRPAAAPAPAPPSPPPPAARPEPATVANEVAPPLPAPVRTMPARAAAPPERRSAPRLAKPVQPATAGKRVGLYMDTEAWATLKELSIERARQGLRHEYTDIVLEALKKQYPNRPWGI